MSDVRKLFNGELDDGLNAELQSVLQKQIIDNESPGHILKNIERLIEAIGTGMPTTSAYYALPQGKLIELNLSLSQPLTHDLKRPQLRSFPILAGLFSLLRGSGLAVGETKPRRIVKIDPVMFDRFSAMNATERYMNLLSTWFYEAGLECIGETSRRFGGRGMIADIRNVYMYLEQPVTSIIDNRSGIVFGIRDASILGLMHQFGWIRLTYDKKPAAGKTASMRRIERTKLGDAMFAATCQLKHILEERSENLREQLGPFFPEWKLDWTEPELEYRDGEHTFKVAIGDAWRRIVAPASADLDELANAILNAYRFDNSHLYQYKLFDRRGHAINILGPELDDGEHFTDEMRIGELPMLIGDSIVFHYDFGDDWMFKVTLESIDEKPSRKNKMKVTAKSGDAPKQYDNSDWP